MANAYYSTQWAGLAADTVVAVPGGTAVIGVDAFSDYSLAKAAGDVVLCDVFCSSDWAGTVASTVDVVISGDTYTLNVGEQAFGTFEAAANQVATNQYGGVSVYAGVDPLAANVFYSGAWNELEDYSVVFVGNTVWDATGNQLAVSGGTAIIGVNAFGTKTKADAKAATYTAQTATVTEGSGDVYLHSDWITGAVIAGDTVTVTLADGSTVTAVYGANAVIMDGTSADTYRTSIGDAGVAARNNNQVLYFVGGSIAQSDGTTYGGDYTWGAKTVVYNTYIQRISGGGAYDLDFKIAPEVYLLGGATTSTAYVGGYTKSDSDYLYIGKNAVASDVTGAQGSTHQVVTLDVDGGTVIGTILGGNVRIEDELNYIFRNGAQANTVYVGAQSGSDFFNLACDVNISVTGNSKITGYIQMSNRSYGRDSWDYTGNASIKDVTITIKDSYVKSINNETSAWSFNSYNVILDGGTVGNLYPRYNTGDYYANYCSVVGGTAAITGGTFRATAGGTGTGDNAETDWLDADVRFLTTSSTKVTYNSDGTISVVNGVFYNAAASDANQKWIVGGTATFVGGTHNLVTLSVTGNTASTVNVMKGVQAITIDATAELLVPTTYEYSVPITIDATDFAFSGLDRRKLVLTTPGTGALTGSITVLENGTASTDYCYERIGKYLFVSYAAVTSMAWWTRETGDQVVVGGNTYTIGTDAFATEAQAKAAGWKGAHSVDIYVNSAWADAETGDTVYAVLHDGSTVSAIYGVTAFSTLADGKSAASTANYNLYVVDGSYASNLYGYAQPTVLGKAYLQNYYGTSAATDTAEVYILGGTVGTARSFNANVTDGYLYMEGGTSTGNILPGNAGCETTTMEIVGSTITGVKGSNSLSVSDSYNLILRDHSVVIGDVWVGTDSGYNMSGFTGDINITVENSQIKGSINFSSRSTSFWANAFSITMQNINIDIVGGTVGRLHTGGSTPWNAVKSLSVTLEGASITTNNTNYSQITTEITGGTATFISGGTVVTMTGSGGSIASVVEVLEAGTQVEGNVRWIGGSAVYNADGSVTITGKDYGTESGSSALLYIGDKYYNLQQGESVTVTGGTYARKTLYIKGGSSRAGTITGMQDAIIDADSYFYMTGSGNFDTISVDVTGYHGESREVAHFPSIYISWTVAAIENGTTSRRYTAYTSGYTIKLAKRYTYFAGAWENLEAGDKVVVNGSTLTVGTNAFSTYAAALADVSGDADHVKVGDFFVNDTWVAGDTVSIKINDENIDFTVNDSNAFTTVAAAYTAYTAAKFTDGSFTVEAGTHTIDGKVSVNNMTVKASADLTTGALTVAGLLTVDAGAKLNGSAISTKNVAIGGDLTLTTSMTASGTLAVTASTTITATNVTANTITLDAGNTLTVTGNVWAQTLSIDATSYELADNERKLLVSANKIIAENYVLNQTGSDYYLSLEGNELYLTHAPVYYSALWADLENGDQVVVDGNTYTIGTDAFANYADAEAQALATGGAVRDLDTYFDTNWTTNQLGTIKARGGNYSSLIGGTAAKAWLNGYTSRDLAKTAHTNYYADGGIVVTGGTYTSRTEMGTTAATPIIYKNLISTGSGDQFLMLFKGTTIGDVQGGYAVIGSGSTINTLALAQRNTGYTQGEITVKVVDDAKIDTLLIGGLYEGYVGNVNETESYSTNVYISIKDSTVTSVYGGGYSSACYANVTLDVNNVTGARIYGGGTLAADKIKGDFTVNMTSSTYTNLISWYNSNVGAAYGMEGTMTVNVVGGSNYVGEGLVLRNTDAMSIKAGAYLYTRSITNYATDETRYAGTISVDATGYTSGKTLFLQTRLGGIYNFTVTGSDQYKITREASGDGWKHYLQRAIAYYTSDWKDLAEGTSVVAGGETVTIGTYAFTTYAAAQATGWDVSVGDFFANDTWTSGGTITETIAGETITFIVNDSNAFTTAAAAYTAYQAAGFVDGSFTVEAGTHTIDEAVSVKNFTLGATADLTTGDLAVAGNFTFTSGAKLTAGAMTTNDASIDGTVHAASWSVTGDLTFAADAAITVTGALTATGDLTAESVTIDAASVSANAIALDKDSSITLTGALTSTGAITIDATGAELAEGARKLLVAASSVTAGSFVVLENGTASSDYVANVTADGLYLQRVGTYVNSAWLGLAAGTKVQTSYGEKTLGTDAFATFADAIAAGKSADSIFTMDANYNTAWTEGDTVTLATAGSSSLTAVVTDGNAYDTGANNAYTTKANAIANKNAYAIAHSYGATTGQGTAAYTTYDGTSRNGMVYENGALGDSTVGIGDVYVISSTFSTRMRGYSNGSITNGSTLNYRLDNSYVKTYTNLGSSYGTSLSVDLNNGNLTGNKGWWTFNTNLVLVNGSTIASVNPYGRGGGGGGFLDVHGSFSLTVDASYAGTISIQDEWGSYDFLWDEGFNVAVQNGGTVASLGFSNRGANSVTLSGGTVVKTVYLADRAARTTSHGHEREAISVGAITWSVTGGETSSIVSALSLRAADATYSGRTSSDTLTIDGNSTLSVTGNVTNSGAITIDVGSLFLTGGTLTTTGSFTIDATNYVFAEGVYQIKVVDAKNTLSVDSFTLVGGATGVGLFVKDGDIYYGEATVKFTVLVDGMEQGETIVIGGNTYTVGTDVFATNAAAVAAGHHVIESLDVYVSDAWTDLEEGAKVVVEGYTATIGTDAFAIVKEGLSKATSMDGALRILGGTATGLAVREVDTRFEGVETITSHLYGNTTETVVNNVKLTVDGGSVTTAATPVIITYDGTVNGADITLNNVTDSRIWAVQTGATLFSGTLTLDVDNTTLGCFTLGGNSSGWSGITSFCGSVDADFTDSTVGVIGFGYRDFGSATNGNSGAGVKDYVVKLTNSTVGVIGTGDSSITGSTYKSNTFISSDSFTIELNASTVTRIDASRNYTSTTGGSAVITGGTHTGEAFAGTYFYNMGGTQVFNDDGTVTYRGGTQFSDVSAPVTGGTMTITGGSTARRTVNVTGGSNYAGAISSMDALNISVGDYLKVGGILSATLNVTIDARGYEFAPETYRVAVLSSGNSTFNSKFTYLQDAEDENVFTIVGDTLYYGESDTVVSRAWVDREAGDTVVWGSNTYTIGTDAFANATQAAAANRHYIVNADTYVYLGANAGDTVTIDGNTYTVYNQTGSGREVFTSAADAAYQLNSIQGKRVVILGGTGSDRQWLNGADAYVENCTHFWADAGGIVGAASTATASTSIVFASGATVGQYWSTHGANVTNAYAEVQSGAYVDNLYVSYSGAVVTNADFRVLAGGVVGNFYGGGSLGEGGLIKYTVNGGTVTGNVNTGTTSKDSTNVKGSILVTLTGATILGGLLGGSGGTYTTNGTYTYNITDSSIGGTFGYTGTGGADMGQMVMASFSATIKDSTIHSLSLGRVSTTAGAFTISLDNVTIDNTNLGLTAPNSASSFKGVNATLKNMTRATGNVTVIDPESATSVTVDGDIDVTLQSVEITEGCLSITGGATGSTISGDITVDMTDVVIGTSIYVLNGGAKDAISVTGDATLNFNNVTVDSGIYFSTCNDAATAIGGTRSINLNGGTNTIGSINESDVTLNLKLGASLVLTDNSRVTNAITVDAKDCDYSQARYLLVAGSAPVTNAITIVNADPTLSADYILVYRGNNVYYQQKPAYFSAAWAGLSQGDTVVYDGNTLTYGTDAFATYTEAGTSGKAIIYAAETYLNNSYNATDPIVLTSGYTATYGVDAFSDKDKALSEAARLGNNVINVTGWTSGDLIGLNGFENVNLSGISLGSGASVTVKNDAAEMAKLNVSFTGSTCNVCTMVGAGTVTGDLNVTATGNSLCNDGLYIVTGSATVGGNVNVTIDGDAYLKKGLYAVNDKASVTGDVSITLGDCEIYRKGVLIFGAVTGTATVTVTGNATVSSIRSTFDTVTINEGASLTYGRGLEGDWQASYLYALNNLVNNGTFNYNAEVGQNAYLTVAYNVSGTGTITSTTGNVIFTNGGTTFAAEKQDMMLVDTTLTDKSFLDVVTIGGTDYIYGISVFNDANDAAASQFHDSDTAIVAVGSTVTETVHGNGNIGFAGSTVSKSAYAGTSVSSGTVSTNTSITILGVEGTAGSYSALIGGSDVKGDVTQSGSSSITVTGENNITAKALVASSYVTGGTLTLEGSTSSITMESGSFSSFVIGGALVNKAGARVDGTLNTNVVITGGTMKAVAGGCYLQGGTTVETNGTIAIDKTSTTNVTISGGVILTNVYGGNISKSASVSTNTSSQWGGSTNVTIDATNTVKICGSVIAGSYGKGQIGGNTHLTFTGSGANLTINGNIVGGSSSGTDADNSSGVTGTRTLTFDHFTGTLGSNVRKVIGFTDVEVNGGSVQIAGYGQLKSVSDWSITDGTIEWTKGTNDFSLDKLTLTHTDALSSEWTVFQLTSDLTTGWNEFTLDKSGVAKVALSIGGEDGTLIWNDDANAYRGTISGVDYKFYLDTENYALKVAKLA